MLDGMEDAVPGVEAVVDLVGEGRAVGGCVPVKSDSQIEDFISKYAETVLSYLPMSSGKWTTSLSMDLQ